MTLLKPSEMPNSDDVAAPDAGMPAAASEQAPSPVADASPTQQGTLSLRDHAEAVGLCADTIDNLTGAMSLPMPAQFHLDQLKVALPRVVQQLRAAFVGITGENPWGEA